VHCLYCLTSSAWVWNSASVTGIIIIIGSVVVLVLRTDDDDRPTRETTCALSVFIMTFWGKKRGVDMSSFYRTFTKLAQQQQQHTQKARERVSITTKISSLF